MIEIDSKVQKAKMLMGLKVYAHGVKKVNALD